MEAEREGNCKRLLTIKKNRIAGGEEGRDWSNWVMDM